MIRKTLKHSKSGSLAGGINYVLNNTNSKNEPRPTPPKILVGDKDALLEIEKNMTSEHTYVHSVLSFTKEEALNLTDEDKQEIAESYIEQLAAGLPSADRLGVLAVDHGDDMHFLCLRKDLESDKSYQPYVQQRGDAHRFELWNESMQEQYKELIDPNDPSLVKLSKTGAAHPKEHKDKTTLRDQVLDDINARFAQKEFKNRDAIIDYLKQRDDIKLERVTNKSISISSTTNPNMQNIRLKGALFEKNWDKINENFKPVRAKPKPPQPTLKLSEINKKLKENAIKKYRKTQVHKGHSLHKALQNNNEKLNELLLKNNAINDLKNNIDNSINPQQPTQQSLMDKFNQVAWKDAIQAAKEYNFNNKHTEEETLKVAVFLKNANEFLENYENYKAEALEKFSTKEPSEKDKETDSAWMEMYHDTAQAINNMTDDLDNDPSFTTNLSNLENELQSLENNMQQQEQVMQNETIKQTQKTQQKQSGGEKKGKPSATKGFEQAMNAIVNAWKQQEFAHKRNDARNYAISQKNASDAKPKPKKKDDD